MKIRTVIYNLAGVKEFDDEVNAAMADGWHLVKREVLPGFARPDGGARRMLYAELAQLDEPAKPQPVGPLEALEALRTVRDYCGGRDGEPGHVCEGCPLGPFCDDPRNGLTPDVWEVPEG